MTDILTTMIFDMGPISKDPEDWWSAVFADGESASFSDDPRGTSVYSVGSTLARYLQYVSLNPLYADRDTDPDPGKRWHDPSVGRRADANVSAHRNFLVEIDHADYAHNLRKQRDLVESVALPWSACAWSGNKSLHYIVCLAEPLSATDYREYAERLHRVPRIRGIIDSSVRNPSRFTRTCMAVNKSTRNVQSVVGSRRRITLVEFERWLQSQGSFPLPKPKPRVFDPCERSAEDMLNIAVKAAAKRGKTWGSEGSRHSFMASVVGAMKKMGADRDAVIGVMLSAGYIIDEPGRREEELRSMVNKFYQRK